MNLRFRTEAVSDVVLAKEWYEARRSGLGAEFVDSLERTVGLLGALTDAFPSISEGLRRALLSRFPYAVYYRVDEAGVEVIACLHTMRSPSRWRDRA